MFLYERGTPVVCRGRRRRGRSARTRVCTCTGVPRSQEIVGPCGHVWFSFFVVIRKEAWLFCGSFLRKGGVFAYGGRNQNLNDQKISQWLQRLPRRACLRSRPSLGAQDPINLIASHTARFEFTPRVAREMRGLQHHHNLTNTDLTSAAKRKGNNFLKKANVRSRICNWLAIRVPNRLTAGRDRCAGCRPGR